MAVSSAFLCPAGTKLEIDAIGSSFTNITTYFSSRLLSITMGEVAADETETTHSETTPDSDGIIYRTYDGACLAEEGEITVDVYFNKNMRPAVGLKFNFRMTFPMLSGESTAVIHDFEGIVKRYAPQQFNLIQNEKANARFTIRISGKITVTAAT